MTGRARLAMLEAMQSLSVSENGGDTWEVLERMCEIMGVEVPEPIDGLGDFYKPIGLAIEAAGGDKYEDEDDED